MASIFSRIAAGEIPCYKVAETDDFLAFLDVNPVVKGHVLCIPKQEVDYIFDLDDDLFTRLHLFSKRVAKGLKKVCPCRKIGVAVVGIDVPHVHIHLMPINQPGDLNFARHIQMEPADMAALADQIARAVE
ncbi:MAG: Hit-like protein involved in cell-cycle regulation [bacterium P3]|nr:MAG: Hit-like protein involved in cell-cycle regulation [bacterium P3]KWW41447.1 MAG: Hit-like protein involved in cell-cycle regulation [bacterium F083]